MSIICKSCNAFLRPSTGRHICKCGICGVEQTVPETGDEIKEAFYNQANEARRNGRFDTAAGLYKSIAVKWPEDAECYWGLILCKYGVQYDDDPKSVRKILVCRKDSPACVFDDSDYMQAIRNADPEAGMLYRQKAEQIEQIRKGNRTDHPEQSMAYAADPQTQELLKLAFMKLEDGHFGEAEGLFDQILNKDPKCGRAYWGIVYCRYRAKNIEELALSCWKILFKYRESRIMSADIVPLAREADWEYDLLTDKPDDELRKMFTDREIEEKNRWEVTSQSLELILKDLNPASLAQYLDCPEFKMALMNADLEITDEADRLKDTVIQMYGTPKIKDILRIEAEQKQQVEAELTEIIRSRLAKIYQESPPLKKNDEEERLKEFYQKRLKEFGKYYYNSNAVKEPIKWKIIGIEDNRILIVSEYGLDVMPFDTINQLVNWEKSTLRKWLNDTFLIQAFTFAEREQIIPEKLYGNNSDKTDKIFILSDLFLIAQQASTNEDMRAKPTPYAVKKGALTVNGYCQWWVRETQDYCSGQKSFDCPCFYDEGIKIYSIKPSSDKVCVRPALWLDITTYKEKGLEALKEDEKELNEKNDKEYASFTTYASIFMSIVSSLFILFPLRLYEKIDSFIIGITVIPVFLILITLICISLLLFGEIWYSITHVNSVMFALLGTIGIIAGFFLWNSPFLNSYAVISMILIPILTVVGSKISKTRK